MDQADRHRYFEELAVAHVLGGLPEPESRVFRSHLLECADCRARVGELRALAHDLADVERDERRVRAAQVIETKRREDEDPDEELEEIPEASRASRVTVIIGLLLVIGLSLWNFTLRQGLGRVEQINRELVAANGVLDSGEKWRTIRREESVEGSVTSRDAQFVLILDGLDDETLYGLYTMSGAQAVEAQQFKPDDGQVNKLFALPADADAVVVKDPGEGNTPQSVPQGLTVYEARR
ncbi:MAG: zf-HC2 domain-containing protein [Egibacteraceae bacterium]